MKYLFRGRLRASLCAECLETLSEVKVRLYKPRSDQDVTALAVASPKDTLAILNDDQLNEKGRFLLAETTTDAEGRFSFSLDDKNYDGGAFEVDVYCGTVPYRKLLPPLPPPRQFTVTMLRPMWKQGEAEVSWYWDYYLPYRFWCWFRGLFGAWTICGKVTTCQDNKTPIGGVTVTAFDADWWQTDALGTAVTDGSGHFRIDYTTADFQKTPFSPLINIEFTSGPDVFFRIEAPGGAVLLDEPAARGRSADRENVGPCFCVDLCVDTDVPPPYQNPLFTHVGDFSILASISAMSGLTNAAVAGHGGPSYGFSGYIKLKGFCPKTSPIGAPDPMRYRFLYEDLAAPGLIPITPDKIFQVVVGARLIQWDTFGTGLQWTFQTTIIAGSGATADLPTPPVVPPGTPWGAPPDHVIVPDANGWVAVDQRSLDDGFYGPLLRFMTTSVEQGGTPAPLPVAGAGPASPKSGRDYRIVFEAGPVGGAATFSNDLPRIRINNWGEVMQLNLLQFHTAGATACSEVTSDVDIEYTADHELLASWGIGISSAAPFPNPGPLPGGAVPRGGNGSHHLNIVGWPSCSYTVSLSTLRSLTDGETDDSTKTTSLTFCK